MMGTSWSLSNLSRNLSTSKLGRRHVYFFTHSKFVDDFFIFKNNHRIWYCLPVIQIHNFYKLRISTLATLSTVTIQADPGFATLFIMFRNQQRIEGIQVVKWFFLKILIVRRVFLLQMRDNQSFLDRYAINLVPRNTEIIWQYAYSKYAIDICFTIVFGAFFTLEVAVYRAMEFIATLFTSLEDHGKIVQLQVPNRQKFKEAQVELDASFGPSSEWWSSPGGRLVRRNINVASKQKSTW